MDFVGVSAVLVEEVYFWAPAHAKREAALFKLGTAIDQHIVVPPWRRAAGMNSLQTGNRRTVPNTGDRRYPIRTRRLILGCQSAGRGDFGIWIEVRTNSTGCPLWRPKGRRYRASPTMPKFRIAAWSEFFIDSAFRWFIEARALGPGHTTPFIARQTRAYKVEVKDPRRPEAARQSKSDLSDFDIINANPGNSRDWCASLSSKFGYAFLPPC